MRGELTWHEARHLAVRQPVITRPRRRGSRVRRLDDPTVPARIRLWLTVLVVAGAWIPILGLALALHAAAVLIGHALRLLS